MRCSPGSSLRWLQRLFSSSSKPGPAQLPAAVLELLQASPVSVQQIAGQGRGLVATRDLRYGEVLFSEQPFLCVPAHHSKGVCCHCLGQQPQQLSTRSSSASSSSKATFCSASCLAAARASYYDLESQLDLKQLRDYCEAQGERFPLMAARLALMDAQRAMQQQQLQPHATGSAAPPAAAAAAASQAADPPSAALSFLCFANVPPPPPAPWVESHALLMAALQAACDCRENRREGEALAAALSSLSIEWYVAVLARLHLNTFKVDAVVAPDWSNMHAAAAAMLQPGSSSSGSALYLLASLFNHSCEPSVNITFPRSDSTAVFTAARDIAAGEQLHISYMDCDQEVDVRQQYLAFSYGFHCSCPRCVEDIALLQKGTGSGGA